MTETACVYIGEQAVHLRAGGTLDSRRYTGEQVVHSVGTSVLKAKLFQMGLLTLTVSSNRYCFSVFANKRI